MAVHTKTCPAYKSSASSMMAKARVMMAEAATIGKQARALIAEAVALKEQTGYLETIPTTSQPETSSYQEAQAHQQNKNPSVQHAPQHTSSNDTQQMPQLQASDSAKIKICLYCKALHHNSEWSSTEIAIQIRAITGNNFDATHKQFKDRGNKPVLPPGGCSQFLLAAIEDRRIAIIGQTDICPICLASPKMKYPNGQCKGKHVIREMASTIHFVCTQGASTIN